MKTKLFLLFFLPAILFAQDFQREINPFPVDNYGRIMPAPFIGGFNDLEPYFVDIDADGDYDLFAGDYDGNIWYFRNDGSSEAPDFTFITDHLDSINLNPKFCYRTKICFCDIDADGDQDLFISGTFINTPLNSWIYFYRNVGDSQYFNFEIADSTFAGIASNSYIQMDFCDIDNDGDFDLFWSSFQNENPGMIRYYKNIGTPQDYQFQYITQSLGSINIYAICHPRFIDIDNDNDYDLFIGAGMSGGVAPDTANGQIFYYENVGTPEVYNYQLVSTFYEGIFVQDEASPCFADIDYDGDYDLFIGKGDDTPYFSTGNMGGDLVFYQNNGTAVNPNFDFVTNNYLGIDIGLGACARFCDIDADGDKDLFISHICNHIVFYRNIGNAQNPHFSLESEQYQGIEWAYGLTIDFADIDADGDYDLFLYSGVGGDGNIILYINQGTPYEADFELETSNLIGEIESATPCLVDIDADNDYDLFVGYLNGDDGAIKYYENQGDSLNYDFVLMSTNYFNITSPYLPPHIEFADIDCDNDFDLYLTCWNPYSSSSFSIREYTNIGTPRNANFVLTDTCFAEISVSQYSANPEFFDIDSDGDMDLFIGEYWGGINFYRNLQYSSVSNPERSVINSFSLRPCYPNPFNPSIIITFCLDQALPVKLSVYNQLGQEVITIINNQMSPGDYRMTWDASQFSSGLYLISLESNLGIHQTQKVILIK
jgi:hypothetical protein